MSNPEQQLSGKTAVITSGVPGELEHEIAHNLASCGARVILLSKNPGPASSNNAITFMEVDLGSLQSVKDVADTIAMQEDRLDLVIAAGGIGIGKLEDYDTNDMESNMGINYFSHFMLINRLLPLLRKTLPPPRVIISSSQDSALPDISFSSPTELTAAGCSEFGPDKLHARAELAKMLFAQYGLTKFVLNKEVVQVVVVNYAAAEGKGVGGVMKKMFKKHDKQVREEVDSVMYAATSPDVTVSGMCVTKPGKIQQASRDGELEDLGSSLWALSNQVVTQKLGKDALLDWNAE